MTRQTLFQNLLRATVLAVALSTGTSKAAGVHEFNAEYSSVQWANGWTYRYIDASAGNRHKAHYASSAMTRNGSAWQVGVNLSTIGKGWLWNNWQYDPLITWNAQASNLNVTVSMNGLSVSSGAVCYLDFYDLSTNTMTTLAEFSEGVHNDVFRLDLDTGDRLYFGKKANLANYVPSYWNPVITIIPRGTLIKVW